ncbi:hypothetical protein CKAH01_16860 [Colletotrichum kahawae]|uniref:Uncharacterized protein n=1 Tax=Colletotrichum kahawae TaxID=34407 RepID=A0AAD9YCB2_COLKA|nr:hypothetical protein CKAH01_16860 [Colletotrichum kahawae]
MVSRETSSKSSHKHSSKDSRKTQAKRRQSIFEGHPDSHMYHVSGQGSNAELIRSQHKEMIERKIANFDKRFGKRP